MNNNNSDVNNIPCSTQKKIKREKKKYFKYQKQNQEHLKAKIFMNFSIIFNGLFLKNLSKHHCVWFKVLKRISQKLKLLKNLRSFFLFCI